MATKRITVSLPLEVAVQMERAAARTASVSAWVTDAVTRTLGEEQLRDRFLAFCDGVPATAAEEKQAKVSFDRIVRPKKARRGRTAA